jgi:hypothetical protein
MVTGLKFMDMETRKTSVRELALLAAVLGVIALVSFAEQVYAI